MLIYGSKLGHFPKIENLFHQNGRDQNIVKIQNKKFLPSLLHKLDKDL